MSYRTKTTLSLALGLLLTSSAFAADTVDDAMALRKNGDTDVTLVAWAASQPPIEATREHFKAVKQAGFSSAVVQALILGDRAQSTQIQSLLTASNANALAAAAAEVAMARPVPAL